MRNAALTVLILLIFCSIVSASLPGNALQFDGVDDYVEISLSHSFYITTHLTIEMWIKPSEVNRRQYLWRQPGNWWQLRIEDTGYLLFYYDYGLVASTTFEDSLKWYHIACTYDSTKMKIYINGSLSGEHSIFTSGGNSYGPFHIGYESQEITAYKGLIDEVRVWERARSQQQILSMMNDTLSSVYYEENSDSGLVAYWRFDEDSGSTTVDLTANHHDGLVSGAVFIESDPMLNVKEEVIRVPDKYVLEQNYPNPFNPTTTIGYRLSAVSDVDLNIYNILGQEVATLVSGKQPAGSYQVAWDASPFPSGIYYYILDAGEFQEVKKMVLIK